MRQIILSAVSKSKQCLTGNIKDASAFTDESRQYSLVYWLQFIRQHSMDITDMFEIMGTDMLPDKSTLIEVIKHSFPYVQKAYLSLLITL